MFLLGYDIGSSSIKAALVNADTNEVVGIAQYPSVEMDIISSQNGWAEQQPETWWANLILATKELISKSGVDPVDIKGIGISYQMHGLVLVDADHNALRPSIIWCDSRAVDIGDQAFETLGKDKCLTHLLNSPGNFTASKLKWVRDNEPELLRKTHKILLPGDYIAMKMTGEISTTIQGLSEGIFWDFKNNRVADFLLDHYEISADLIPDYTSAFQTTGTLSSSAAELLGLKAGVPVSYRAGDQPNNAMSLGVLESGEIAATGGTSGVVYGVVDKKIGDSQSRVNSFAHVNYTESQTRIGVLLCINGAGIQYGWIKNQLTQGMSYIDMEKIASTVPIGSDSLRILPFGNGSERMLGNRNLGSHIINLQFNRHTKAHYYRAALEGIAYSFVYGINMMKELGLDIGVLKVGNDNLFQSSIFSNTISSLINADISVIETTGAVGAAKASGIVSGIYSNLQDAFKEQKVVAEFTSNDTFTEKLTESYGQWTSDLENVIKNYN